MAFDITLLPSGSILEIVYPASPTATDVADYAARLRDVIAKLPPAWGSLVDQRDLQAMPKELLRAIAVLNVYAEQHGMQRSARIVADREAGMSSWRIAREGSVRVPIRSFDTREDALDWLERSLGASETPA